MDKKMKRVIGYAPKQELPATHKERPLKKGPDVIIPEVVTDIVNEVATPVQPISEIISAEIGKVGKIVKWINTHPEFKWGVMCNKIGIDKGNFQRTLNSDAPKIKIEYISKIEEFLKEYGYAK